MKKFGFSPCFVILLLCVVALTSVAAFEIAPTNKISKDVLQKHVSRVQEKNMSQNDVNKFESSENKNNVIVDVKKAQEGVVIHRRARPNKSSAHSLEQPFIFGLSLLMVLPLIVIQY
ncbi:hypothetical protein K7X08_022505 [Anisodus acutangulus]|uniref:Transmembrane protein n=1 Tax=Anisodus acutangulus TaxID=402998 RepID=A0A9Q1MHT6_9SOLA|nr:hypothetical protein K7X08_022505 [Anisodus acutangulus]